MLEKFTENKKLGGINALIYKDGQIIYRESIGLQNLEKSIPIQTDTIFRISSMTKPITSLFAMMMIEENKLDLMAPITQWLPQFKHMQVLINENGDTEPANRVITVMDLLTHRSGFTYSEFQKGKLRESYLELGGDIDTMLTQDEWINTLSKLPLMHQPGDLFHYGRSTDLLGILISKIEGKSLEDVMYEKIFEPLGMRDTFFNVPEEKKSRCASNMGFNKMGQLFEIETVPMQMAFKNRPLNLEFESGGQGLWSTIDDYLKFARLFIEEGHSNGVQLLKKDNLDKMTKNQLTPEQRQKSTLMGNPMFNSYYGFGLGLAVVMEDSQFLSIPCSGSVGSVGWPGAYGGWWYADPNKKAIALFLTHSMTTPQQLSEGIGFELYEAIDEFSNLSRKLIG